MNATSSQPDTTSVTAITPRQRMLAVSALFVSVALGTLETSTANLALPAIAADLNASEADVIWVVNLYQIGMVATLLPIAALGEILGYHRISVIGLAIFALSSIVCALAPNLPVLLIGRVFMGVGAAGIMGVTGAMMRHLFPSGQLGRMLGINATVVAVGVSLGPTVAGIILAIATWPWLFAYNAPLGLAALLVLLKTLPATPRAKHRFDFIGAALAMSAVSLIVGAISLAARHTPLAVVGAMIVAGVLFGMLLVRRQHGHPAPMLPVDLLRIPLFALSIGTSMCAYATQSLGYVALPFFVQNVMQRSAVETGMIMTTWPVLAGIMGLIAGPLADRYKAGMLGSIGLATLAAGMALLAMLDAQSTIYDAMWRLALCGIGFGFFQSPNLKAIMTSAPHSRAGGASGSIATARLSGQAIGAALVALCYLIADRNGATLAFWLAASVSLLGAAFSVSRLSLKQSG